MAENIPFDFAAWRANLGWTQDQVCEALGCSRSHYWKLEKAGVGPRVWAWAAHGITLHSAQKTKGA